MIVGATVERFRGLQRLEVDGFGRVNLIIGKNNCGKTALMEALEIVDNVDDAANVVLLQQQSRDRGMQPEEFEQCWLPLFWHQDAERGFRISAREPSGSQVQVELRKGVVASPVIAKVPGRSHKRHALWVLELSTTTGEERRIEEIASTDQGLQLPKVRSELTGGAWMGSGWAMGSVDVKLFSELKRAGRDAELLDVLKQVDDRITSLELLAPTGAGEIFIRLDQGTPPLPLSMMGDGFRRCVDIGVTAIAYDWPTLFVDEIENGLHHSVLEPVFRWIASISAERQIQVFATTHSEECIQAACRAFTAANDEGLRVIRLDRREEGTFATIYDRSLVEAATEMGVEIRG